ncbi:uncharacterized membrane protein YcaP (DUF421 family) [Peribacillus deserti]|uniref:Uncharacterized membrane protein YcaP (DUF421 family) n=1 Tax=Peribacillus deserti TaxID=673318 RepID=A0ABS2QJY5_9BACI|nr:DUF421 domain-containing protein [Peribacillus deserti]MBM7693463.1 uncharacterized membrane protein YcaP (DUF421 family) [Peribacillus deserti]
MTVFDVMYRSLIFIVILFIITKILGKKHISQLSLFEYITGITLGDIAGEVIMSKDMHIMHGITGLLVFSAVSYFSDYLTLKNRKLREIIEGKDTIIIQDGKILEEGLKKEKYSVEDLESLLRDKGIFKVKDVEYALLEPKGKLSVLLKKENQPLTAKDLGLNMPNEKEPQTVIMDGQIVYEALRKSGKNLEWLKTELEKLGTTIDQVFFAQIDTYGELSADLYQDQISIPNQNERQLLLAVIKRTQAELEMLSLQTEEPETQKIYSLNADKMKAIQIKIEPYLRE